MPLRSASGSVTRKARPTGCRRKPSGSMPAVPGPPPATQVVTIPRRWPRLAKWPMLSAVLSSQTGQEHSKPTTAMCLPLRSGSLTPTHLDCTTCTEMHGSGVRTGTRRNTTPKLRWTTRLAQTPGTVVCFAGAPGSTSPVPLGLPVAVGTNLKIGTTTLVSALLGLCNALASRRPAVCPPPSIRHIQPPFGLPAPASPVPAPC